MNKQSWPPGNMLYPVPAVLVSLRDKEGRDNLITVAWAGTVCSDPAMLSISVRKERYSHHILKETGEFVVNLSTSKIIRAVDLCGVKSGRDTDKFKLTGLTKGKAVKIDCPIVEESPVNIECKVRQILELGTHDMFIAEVLNVQVDESLLNERGALKLEKANLIAYSHGDYFTLGKKVGSFGYSVRKPSKDKKPRSGRPGRRKS
ncbi:MAG: flavin reductase family protein [Lachnospiraceae bacterium]|nr:flavin reductase family protein [Lachnospiraceae bacterium]